METHLGGKLEMRRCFSFSVFNQLFNENREELLLLMENVSQKNIKNGREPAPHWSPSAPAKASSTRHKNITALRQVSIQAGCFTTLFIFCVDYSKSSRGNVLSMAFGQINWQGISFFPFLCFEEGLDLPLFGGGGYVKRWCMRKHEEHRVASLLLVMLPVLTHGE